MRSTALRLGTGLLAVAAAFTGMTGTATAGDDPKATGAAVSALSSVPYVTITSAGPIGSIHLGNELSCQVNIASPASTVVGSGLVGFGGGGQVYGPSHEPADCGTFLSYGGMLYGPDFSSHGYSATPFGWGNPYTAFTPVSQTPPTGSGTLTDPYIVTTVVDAGTTGIRLTRIDTYVTGRTDYRSDVVVTNTTGTALSGLRLYHGLDCYLAGSDTGTGVAVASAATATSRVGCTSNNRTMQLVSQSAGNGYYEDDYWAVWERIDGRLPLPNTTDPTLVDNGIAIDWAFALPAHGSVIRSFLTQFVSSPIVIWTPVDPIRVAVVVRPGESATDLPEAGVLVAVSAAGVEQSFSLWVPTGS
ncbi:MAG TPA: hypothetical protein VNQ77_09815 [Frankiaceae bacterium]|nr:hypothetical protein [Frankiaceae bacterium]